MPTVFLSKTIAAYFSLNNNKNHR